ncbi:MAG: N-acetyl-gamma-glutamyl-phosphate reductase [Candidatus Omnitrophica bacterium]|nr:N-acetyl-gamma-glutamyl-phosphate reductase [Candidatus Omnitrophota bacterium]
MSVKVGIVGVTGYSGENLIRILAKHGKTKIACAMSRSIEEPTPVGKRFPALSGQLELDILPLDEEALARACDVVFLALPHTESMERAATLIEKGKRVVDLAADFRLKDPSLFQKWYGKAHAARDLLRDAAYGLTELNASEIRKARLIANPGCYATSVILAVAPLIRAGYLAEGEFIADAKSGITGAGRALNADFHFPEMDGNAWPYRVNRHAHQPEMEQCLSGLGNGPVRVIFTPQVIPVSRGILTTVYARLVSAWDTARLLQEYKEFYAQSVFVRVREEGYWPHLKDVERTNFCDISLSVDETGKRVIIVSAIDNLIKGASGQAVQNLNCMFGWEESEGLL